jgi:hypothetical protein
VAAAFHFYGSNAPSAVTSEGWSSQAFGIYCCSDARVIHVFVSASATMVVVFAKYICNR